jgi:hypothetical protein
MLFGLGAYLAFKFYQMVLGCLLLGVIAVVIIFILSAVIRFYELVTSLL